jgi:hypothetical protein
MRRLLAAPTLGILLLSPGVLPVGAQQAASQRDKQSQTVHITRSGKKHHLDGCHAECVIHPGKNGQRPPASEDGASVATLV